MVYAAGACRAQEGRSEDAGDYPKGRMTGSGTGSGWRNHLRVDALGRAVRVGQGAGTFRQAMEFEYAANGARKRVVYPSGRAVSYALTDRGRVWEVNGLKEGQGVKYLGGVKYGAGGEMVEGRMGDGALGERKGYNAMGQMTEMEVTGLGGLVGRLTFDYGVSGNNGNLRSQGIETPGGTVRQYYGYDFVNRLRIAWEGPGMGAGQTGETVTCGQLAGTWAAGTWCERMGYDGFGNAWDAEKRQATGLAANGPAWYLLAGNRVTNQMKDVVYDAAGNQTQYVVGSVSRVADYDGEGRIWRVRETGSAPVTVATYFYNAEGWRVKRVAGGVATYYVFDEQGQAVAEYQEGSWTGSGGTRYWYTDHLGTTRMRVRADGTEVSRQDYEPFGGEIVRAGAGYGGAEVGRRFTGKERDGETGLDYFGARYYSGAVGRFTSPDEPFADQNPLDPKTWNLYGYVRNSPLVNVDLSGRSCKHSDGGTPYDDGDGKGCEPAGVSPTPHGKSPSSEDVKPQRFNVDGGPGGAAAEVTYALGAFVGNGPKQIEYGPDNPFTQSFQDSIGMMAILAARKKDCKQDSGRVFVGTEEAFLNALIDGLLGGKGFYNPNAQLGAFRATYQRSNGALNVTVTNPISLNPAAYHATSKLGIANPTSGPLGTVNQTLHIRAEDPCIAQ